MDYNQIAKDIIAELKTHKCTDTEISQRLGISRQAYLRRRDTNSLTTDDITNLSSWLIAGHGGGFYLNNHFGGFMTKAKDELTTQSDNTLDELFHRYIMACTQTLGSYAPEEEAIAETKQAIKNHIELTLLDRLEGKAVRLCDNAVSDMSPTFILATPLTALQPERALIEKRMM